MLNSAKLPIAALSVAALLIVFTFGSIVARVGAGGGATAGGPVQGNVPNGPYGGSKFWSDTVAQTVEVLADPTGQLRWTQAAYTANAGDVTFVVKNPSPITHQFGVEGNGIKFESGNLSAGSTTDLTIKGLPAGEYQIVCNFPGHREAGMVAKLTVTSSAVASPRAGAAQGNVPTASYGGSKFWSDVVAQKVEVSAAPTGQLKWNQEVYTATAGDVTFVVRNPSPITHQFGVEGSGIKYESGNLNANTTTNLTIKGLPPGDYQIVCNFPGHREAGMVAKLTVK